MLEAYAVSPQHAVEANAALMSRSAGARRVMRTDVAPRLRLAQADRVWTEIGSDLLERDYPIGQWVEGETVIDRLKIDYPPVRGPVELQIGQGDQWTTLTTLQLDESRMIVQSAANAAHTIGAVW